MDRFNKDDFAKRLREESRGDFADNVRPYVLRAVVLVIVGLFILFLNSDLYPKLFARFVMSGQSQAGYAIKPNDAASVVAEIKRGITLPVHLNELWDFSDVQVESNQVIRYIFRSRVSEANARNLPHDRLVATTTALVCNNDANMSILTAGYVLRHLFEWSDGRYIDMVDVKPGDCG